MQHHTKAKLLASIAAALAAAVALAQAVPAGTVADIRERTMPFGKLCMQGEPCASDAPAPVAAAAMSGSDVYDRFCHTCHATGLNEAPKTGDAEAWAPRLAKGMEAMLQTTKTGLNLMPVMGLCMSCSDAELQAAIDYMTAPPEAPE